MALGAAVAIESCAALGLGGGVDAVPDRPRLRVRWADTATNRRCDTNDHDDR